MQSDRHIDAIQVPSRLPSLQMVCLSYVAAVFGIQLTLPFSWQPWVPDVFFLSWCIWLRYCHNQGRHLHWFNSWLFGLSVDFWTSPYLGPQAWIYCVMAIFYEVSGSRPRSVVGRPWLVYTLMFMLVTALRFVIGIWVAVLLPLPGCLKWLVTYCVGMCVVMMR